MFDKLCEKYTPEQAAKITQLLLQLPNEGCTITGVDSNETDWHMLRSRGIGGSDIGAILGVSPWKTPYDIWLSKTGRESATTGQRPQTEAARWGNVLEDAIAYEWAKREGKQIAKVNVSLQAGNHQLANVDGFILDNTGRPVGILEIKTSTLNKKDTWENGPIPYYYYLQAQWYCMVTGLKEFTIVCLVGGQHLYSYSFFADAKLHKEMAAAAERFWQLVLTDTPPEKTKRVKAVCPLAEQVTVYESDALAVYIALKEHMESVESFLHKACADGKRVTYDAWEACLADGRLVITNSQKKLGNVVEMNVV